MADIRIKDLATTATTTASDDFMAVDGVTNGTRKLSAATPAFLTSVTTPSLTAPAATNLTLTSGLVGTNRVNFPDTLSASSATAGAVTIGNGTAATNVAIGGGKINIGDTTAGASNAGALVVAGGLATGAASYFGGAAALNTILAAANGYDSIVEIRAGNTNRAQINFYSTSAGSSKWQLFKASDGSDDLVLYGSPVGAAVTFSQATGAATFAGAVTIAGNVGFYNNAPVAKPTGVAVTAAAIHAALVTLNLIAA